MGANHKIQPVILCGGSGTRLWPLSRPEFPKQFLALKGGNSLLEETLLRTAVASSGEIPILVAAAQHRELVAGTLNRADAEAILVLEPIARNTAPAVAAAALIAARRNPDDILLVSPSDHIVDDVEGFARSVAMAACLACEGWITILGVVPSAPSSAFGYIVRGDGLGEDGSRVARFVEKPAGDLAGQLIKQGALWNAGMVVARASDVIDALRMHEPTVLDVVETALDADLAQPEYNLDALAFETAPKISFDHAVLERHARVAVVPLQASWRDVGTWGEVAALHDADEDGNRIVGDVHIIEGKGNFVRSADRRVVALGVKDLVIVDSPDALLVAAHEKLPALSKVIQDLPHEARALPDTSKAEWGHVQEILEDGSSHIRRFAVSFGEATAPALHDEASGHWVVVAGRGVATIGARTCGLGAGETVHLPAGQPRWIANTGADTLEVIEILLRAPIENAARLRKAV